MKNSGLDSSTETFKWEDVKGIDMEMYHEEKK